jgi:hypothetical protein
MSWPHSTTGGLATSVFKGVGGKNLSISKIKKVEKQKHKKLRSLFHVFFPYQDFRIITGTRGPRHYHRLHLKREIEI